MGACSDESRRWDREATQRYRDTGRRHLLGVTIRDDSQASSWPSWIEALCRRTRDEPTDLRGMCAFLHNSSVDLRDLAYLCWGEGAGTSYRGGGTMRPPNANKETGIPRDGRTTCITRDSEG